MKKTKIICTMGPSCSDREILKKMMLAGMNVARFNFSHGTHEEHLERIELFKSVRDELGLPAAMMLDTKGPEYRIKTFKNGSITLQDGAYFALTANDVEGNEERVSVSYKDMIHELNIGDRILLNNGLIILEVTQKTETDVICKVIVGGELSNRKSMSFPNKVLKQVYLSEQDKDDLLFGIKNDMDYVACSFVSCKQDILDVRNFLNENGGNDIDIIAKIENRSGVDNIDEILSVSDGIMVARGDMGVEIPYEELPAIQKKLITTCRYRGKRVITATEMLESMIHNPRPTRAEISDVANAVYDGTSAVMLSGETAAGKYPVEAVQAMSKIAKETEHNIHYKKRFATSSFEIRNMTDALSHSTCSLAMDVGAKVIVACTRSGMTARLISRFRSPIPIIGMTTDEKAYRKLALSWGVLPVLSEEFNSTDVLFYHAVVKAKQSGLADKGDTIVITGGMTNGKSGNTNMIKIETI
ncbi:MAG: pyruvate kinase [Clostridia bacterium]|nr:pyruvate kinase [Clostridia bacterium]